MNVLRAVQLFGTDVLAAFQFLKDNPYSHPRAHVFEGSGPTLNFLKVMHKWFSIHNVGNRSYAYECRDENQASFSSPDDDRLSWLENDFLDYLNQLKHHCAANGKEFLSEDTFQAITLTTKSTVHCIRYLLSIGFQFVLTKAFNSDAIEAFYSIMRQMCGGNDMLDISAATFACEKVLKVGLANAQGAESVSNFLWIFCNRRKSLTGWM